jgi:DNA-binding HxlR family transcriptional regulator
MRRYDSLVRRKSFARWPCSIARTVDLIGDAWTLLVLRELFYGQTKFEEFVDTLGIPRNTLADRLAVLVSGGVAERRGYQVDPVRHEYVLTAQGRDLFGVLASINAWGDRWLDRGDGAPVVMRHEPCKHDLDVHVTCAHCGQVVSAEDVTARTGPGYPAALATHPALASRFHSP